MLRGPRNTDRPRFDRKAVYEKDAAKLCEVSCAQAIGNKYQTAVLSDICFENEQDDVCDYAAQLSPKFDEATATFFNSPDRHHVGHILHPLEATLASQVADTCICMMEKCNSKQIDCFEGHSMAELQVLELNQPVCCSSKHELKKFYTELDSSMLPPFDGGQFDYYRYAHKHICDWMDTKLWAAVCDDETNELHEFRSGEGDENSVAAFTAHKHVHLRKQLHLTADERAFYKRQKNHHKHKHRHFHVVSAFQKVKKHEDLKAQFRKQRAKQALKAKERKLAKAAAQMKAARLMASKEMSSDKNTDDVTKALGSEHMNVDITWAPTMEPTTTDEPTAFPTAKPTRFVSELERAFSCLPDCAMYMDQSFTVPATKLELIVAAKGFSHTCESLGLKTPAGNVKYFFGSQSIPVNQATLLCSCIWDYPMSHRGQQCTANAAHAKPLTPPTDSPTANPTIVPTSVPSPIPTGAPTACPTYHPTAAPAKHTGSPTTGPTSPPTAVPVRVKMLVCFPKCAKSAKRHWRLTQHDTHYYLLKFLDNRHMCSQSIMDLDEDDFEDTMKMKEYRSLNRWADLDKETRLLFCYCANWATEAEDGRECIAQAEDRFKDRYQWLKRRQFDEQQPSWFQTAGVSDWPEIPTLAPTITPTLPPTRPRLPTPPPTAAPTMTAVAEAKKNRKQLAEDLLAAMGLGPTPVPIPPRYKGGARYHLPAFGTSAPTSAFSKVPTYSPTLVPTTFLPLPGLPSMPSSAPSIRPSGLSDDDNAGSSPDMTATADPTQTPTQGPHTFSEANAAGGDDDDKYVDNKSEDQEFQHLLKPKEVLLPVLPALTPAPTARVETNAYKVKQGFIDYFSSQGVSMKCYDWPEDNTECPSKQRNKIDTVAAELKMPRGFFIAWVNGKFNSKDPVRETRAEKLLYVISGGAKGENEADKNVPDTKSASKRKSAAAGKKILTAHGPHLPTPPPPTAESEIEIFDGGKRATAIVDGSWD
jgi:hypothetical protein